ncbi:stigma-specific STIG1-like protein 1 [Ziziphus jujuba]|uniref:Stigma-specific STIG1-like protein 1 n=2 Tax=Ziziphus jujuba TaxID=326968 RepID=A0ABM3I604_ZIZJJ|nr:stigma-specific STIG1-like protein 1 [Ziziphus jujuba]KAH7546758.1 hypothetical protein FEM48_Zijuj01G0235400 [Ziziphus jujuba var. spinosa]
MELIVKMILIITMTMALSITLTMKSITNHQEEEEKPLFLATTSSGELSGAIDNHNKLILPSKRVSRFLAEKKNPRAADHCHKDHEICYEIDGGKNSTCCNNKCVDLSTDKHNCGACKKKCKFPETCCRGKCVYLSLDKRHCGECNHRCKPGEYCFYGMCSYA